MYLQKCLSTIYIYCVVAHQFVIIKCKSRRKSSNSAMPLLSNH